MLLILNWYLADISKVNSDTSISGAVVAQWRRHQAFSCEVHGSNLLATVVMSFGKALYPHCLIHWKGLSLLVHSCVVILVHTLHLQRIKYKNPNFLVITLHTKCMFYWNTMYWMDFFISCAYSFVFYCVNWLLKLNISQ